MSKQKLQIITSFLPSEKSLVNAMTGMFFSLNARYAQLNVKKSPKVNMRSYFSWTTTIFNKEVSSQTTSSTSSFSCIATLDKNHVPVYTWTSKVAFDRFK